MLSCRFLAGGRASIEPSIAFEELRGVPPTRAHAHIMYGFAFLTTVTPCSGYLRSKPLPLRPSASLGILTSAGRKAWMALEGGLAKQSCPSKLPLVVFLVENEVPQLTRCCHKVFVAPTAHDSSTYCTRGQAHPRGQTSPTTEAHKTCKTHSPVSPPCPSHKIRYLKKYDTLLL